MILAQREEYAAALIAQESSGYFQKYDSMLWGYWGLGDLLLSKGKAELAFKSFGIESEPK